MAVAVHTLGNSKFPALAPEEDWRRFSNGKISSRSSHRNHFPPFSLTKDSHWKQLAKHTDRTVQRGIMAESEQDGFDFLK